MFRIKKLSKKKKVGLALGGGAALGAAHVGVLKAVEELNISVRYVSGNSIGAFVGALYCFGTSPEEMQEIARNLKWFNISSLSLSGSGLINHKKLGKLIEETIGKAAFQDAGIPLSIVATDITTGEKIVLKEGSVSQAVRASTAIPGVFEPVEIGGRLLVDGGIVENVPISLAQDMGAKPVIAVDLNARHSYKRPRNLLEVMVNSFHYTLQATAKIQKQNADILIEPDLSAFNRIDTGKSEAMIEAGYSEAMKVLKDLV